MKKQAFFLLLFAIRLGASAQNFYVPDVEGSARNLIEALKAENLTDKNLPYLEWEDYKYYLDSLTQVNPNSHFTSEYWEDSVKFHNRFLKERELKKQMASRLIENGKKQGIIWKDITYKNTIFDIQKSNKENSSNLWQAKLEIFFLHNKNQFSVRYRFILDRGIWKITNFDSLIY